MKRVLVRRHLLLGGHSDIKKKKRSQRGDSPYKRPLESSAPRCAIKSLCLIAWQVKQYSTSICVTCHWIGIEPILRSWTRWICCFSCQGGNRGAFLQDYWCEIVSYGLKIHHFVCMLKHIHTFPLRHTLSPLNMLQKSFCFQTFDTLQDGITELNALSNKMLCLESPQTRKPTHGQHTSNHCGGRGNCAAPVSLHFYVLFVLKQWESSNQAQICNDCSIYAAAKWSWCDCRDEPRADIRRPGRRWWHMSITCRTTQNKTGKLEHPPIAAFTGLLQKRLPQERNLSVLKHSLWPFSC